MKKLAIAILPVFICYAATAQLDRGQLLLGGFMKFCNTSQKITGGKITQSTISIHPDVGYFVKDKWAIGVNLDIGFDKYKYPGSETKSSDAAVGLNSRYYFLPKTNRVNLLAEAAYALGVSKDGNAEKENINRYSLSSALAWFVTEQIAIEAGLSYRSTKFELEEERINRLCLQLGLQIHLGNIKIAQPVSKR